MKKLLAIVFTLVLVCFASSAMALDLHLGADTWGLDTFYDVRVYDPSHPMHGKVFNRGFWYAGFVVLNDKADQIGYVTTKIGPTPEGAVYETITKSPMTYPWLGYLNRDYGVWIGHRMAIETPVTVEAFDILGNPVNFCDGAECVTTMVRDFTVHGQIQPPTVEIKQMMLRKDGTIRIKMKVPFDERFQQLRVRIFDVDNLGAEWQDIYFDQDGMYDIYVPGEFSGRIGRVEYRVFDGNMLRGITFFKLPEVE